MLRPPRPPLALALFALLLLAACGGSDPDDGRPSGITADPPSGTARAPVAVTFGTHLGLDREAAYEWFVDGLPVGNGATIDHTFEAPGQFEVRLEVSGQGGTQSAALDYAVLPSSAYDIVLVFEEGAFTPLQRSMIQAAASRWEQLVVGDVPDNGGMPAYAREGCLSILGPTPGSIPPELQHVDFVDDLLVYVYRIDEESSTLARAGPCYWNGRLPNYGSIEVNQRHLEAMTGNDALTEVMIHELAHVLGVGTLWRARATELLEPSLAHCNDSALEPHLTRAFVGAAAVMEFQALGGDGAPPVDSGCSHWQQDVFGNESLTPSRRIAPGSHTPLSRVTLGSLADLGYVVEYAMADPYSLPLTSLFTPGHEPEYHHGEPFLLLPGR